MQLLSAGDIWTMVIIIGLVYAFSPSPALERARNLERQRARILRNQHRKIRTKMKTIPVTFSDAEQQAMASLEQVNLDTLWGAAIEEIIRTKDPIKFRVLVAQLQCQNRDNPTVMKKILGGAYDSIMAL
jgi:hypothetical protein